MKTPNIVEFTTKVLGLPMSLAQRTLQKSIYGLKLDAQERAVYMACTGRGEFYPGVASPETTVVAGTRAGKDSRIAAPMICYEASFGGHEKFLTRGERGVIACVAQDQRGVGVLKGYVKEHYLENEILRTQLADEPTANEIKLTNRMSIVFFPCTQTAMRGWSIPFAVMDELAFWRLEGAANSDVEIQTSIRRGGLLFPNSKLLKISTPYLRSGVLYDDFKNAFEKPNPDVLVWRAPSVLMNPASDNAKLSLQKRLDPERFAREYEAEFSEGLDVFMPSHWVESAVRPGIFKNNPRDVWTYISAIDQSGLRADSFAHAIGHIESDKRQSVFVLDYLRSYNPTGKGFADLDGTVKSISETSRAYRCTTVVGDRASESWVQARFADNQMGFRVSELDTSQCYLSAEPFFSVGAVDLLDDQVLVRQLKFLEKTQRPGGRSFVTHPNGQHDDSAAAVCRCIANCNARGLAFSVWSGGHRLMSSEGPFGPGDTDLHPMDRFLDGVRTEAAFESRYGNKFWW